VVGTGAALARLGRDGCTVMLGWHQAKPLLDHPDFPRRKLELKKGSGGTHPLATRLLGPDHVSVGMYGMTETATCITCARWDDPEPIRTRTFGRPLAGMELHIVDPETRAPVAPGETGESVAAFVVLAPGRAADAEALRAFCRASLASYKVQRHVFVVEEAALPRTGTGKIEKAALRRAAAARLAGARRDAGPHPGNLGHHPKKAES